MKYYFKENFRLLYADGSLYDENENAVYDYRNTTLLFPDIELYRDGEFIGHVKKNFTIFLREYDIYLGDELVDRLSQELTFFRSELTLQELGWKISDYRKTLSRLRRAIDIVEGNPGYETSLDELLPIFAPEGGATREDVALMRRTVGPEMGVKAAGGIRTLADALAMIDAGANRLGCSAGASILAELRG